MTRLVLPFCLLIAACGSNPAPVITSVTGTVGGNSITSPTAVGVGGFEVFIAGIPQLCSALTADARPKSTTMLFINWGTTDSTGSAQGLRANDIAATYSIVPLSTLDGGTAANLNVAVAWFQVDDATCNLTGPVTGATSGTVNIASATDDGSAEGTFSLQFGMDQLTGAFSAPACPNIGPAVSCN